LRSLVREASPPIQRRALQALGRIGEHGAQGAVPELLAAFGGPDGVGIEALRAAAAVADVEVNAAIHRSWPQLGPAERAAATRALVVAAAGWSDEAAASALAPAIDDPDPRVRSAAALAIAERPGALTAQILEKLRQRDPDQQVQAIAIAVSGRTGNLTMADLKSALADTARPPWERGAHARVLVLAGDDDGIDAALDAVRNPPAGAGSGGARSAGAQPSPIDTLRSGLARHGTAVLLRLGVRSDGEALAEDSALAELWPQLEFHPELAARATALLAARRGAVARLLRNHLADHERELWDYLLERLAAGEDDGGGLVLDALLELGERA
jgi:hypothetical protein